MDAKVWKEFAELAGEQRDNAINKALLESGWPLWTEVVHYLQSSTAVKNNGGAVSQIDWAFGTETSKSTQIPHYQCYLEFDRIVKRSSIYESLEEQLGTRCHIATMVVYHKDYKTYCLKNTSNFEFGSNHYWNIKLEKIQVDVQRNNLLELRPGLEKVKNNYYTGQELLRKIALGPPDDRTGIWLSDVIGGTGKTAFFQTIVTDKKTNGLYLRISDGLERLSSKLRKKIDERLKSGQGYPRFIWINFGRTIDENGLRTFADFGEQILDGMLDDNFGNTGTGDFVPLPYVNLIITANTPPNLNQLTSDRMKLMTLFPIYEDSDCKLVQDSILIPIYVEIKVRILKRFPHTFQYKFIVKLQGDEEMEYSYSQFGWYNELLENVKLYKAFQKTPAYNNRTLQSRLETKWLPGNPNTAQDDVKAVYQKALFFSATNACKGSSNLFVVASSFNRVPTMVEPNEEKIVTRSKPRNINWSEPVNYSKIPESMFPGIE